MKYYSTFLALKTDLDNQVLTLPGVVDHYFSAIDHNRDLNAFIEVFVDEARINVQQIQQKIKSGKAGRLAGMVIGVKDNICYHSHGVSASSKILNKHIYPYSATVLECLLAEDAIITGRLNCVEPVSFKYSDYVVPTYYILTMAEASSNLARYDEVHYGYRSSQAVDLESTYKKSRY